MVRATLIVDHVDHVSQAGEAQLNYGSCGGVGWGMNFIYFFKK